MNSLPNFLPQTTSAYSDEGFMLLRVAISNITAELARSVISGDPAANLALETGFNTPSGGILSTINDLSKLGIGIMNNTLLSAETTRKWMKPGPHTARA
ncbi:hypothetical protein RBB50_012770 [Rhinocladiella similis]